MESSLLLIISFNTLSVCYSTDIVFLAEPSDVTVMEGGTTKICCSYSGTTSNPSWRINDSVHNWYWLPPKHTFNTSAMALLISDVDVSLNNTRYQCFLPTARSAVGTLRVISMIYTDTSSTISVEISPSQYYITAPCANSTNNCRTPAVKSTYIKFNQSFNIIVTDVHDHPHNNRFLSKDKLIGVAVGCTIVTGLLIIILVSVLSTKKKIKTSCWANQLSVVDINLEQNTAYESVRPVIPNYNFSVKTNPAYETVHL